MGLEDRSSNKRLYLCIKYSACVGIITFFQQYERHLDPINIDNEKLSLLYLWSLKKQQEINQIKG